MRMSTNEKKGLVFAERHFELLEQILESLEKQKQSDVPADFFDHLAFNITPSASGSVTVDFPLPYGYLYIPYAPRNLTINWGLGSNQVIEVLSINETLSLEVPRATSFNITYDGTGTRNILDVYFSSRPIRSRRNTVGSASGGSGLYAEDSAAASGDTGTLVLGVRNSAEAVLTSSDGDYSGLMVSDTGRLGITVGNAGMSDGTVASASLPKDIFGNDRPFVIAPVLYDGTFYNRQRGNSNLNIMAAAARTVTTSSVDQTNYNARGIVVMLAVTAFAATPIITLSVEGKESFTGNYFTIFTGPAINVAGTSLNVYVIYPGITETPNVDVSFPLPRIFRVTVTHADADSVTYTVRGDLIV